MAQDGDLLWAESAGGTLTDEGRSIAALPDGGALVAGYFGDYVIDPGVTYTATFGAGEDNETSLDSAGEFDVFVARHNADGTLAWATRAGGTSVDQGLGLAALADGSSLVTGFYQFTATFGAGEDNETSLTAQWDVNLFLARYNPDGTLAWATSAGADDSWTQGNAVAVLADGTALVTGQFDSTATFGAGEDNETPLTSAGQNDLFVAKYNPDGTLAWAKRAGGTANAAARGMGVAALADGSALVTGAFWDDVTFGPGEGNETPLSSAGDWDIFVAKYDTDGDLVWAMRSGGNMSAEGADIAALADGSSLVTGYFEGQATFGPGDPNETPLDSVDYPDIFVAKYNPDGTLSWAKQAGGVDYDYGRGIAALPNGSSLVTGDFEGTATFGAGEPNETSLTSSANWDAFLARYDPDGELMWAKRAGGTGTDAASGNGVSAFDDRSSVVTGTFRGEPQEIGGVKSVVFGPGEDNETTLDSVGGYDIFAAKFDGPTLYTISGTVTLVGGTGAVTDVTLTLTGDESQTISPSGDGTYSITDLEEGTYNVTPSLAGYLFEPIQRDYDPLNADMTNQDYVGTAVYSISGTVTLVGGTGAVTDVTLTLTGDDSQTVAPSGDGTYSITDLEEGTYTVTPSLAGYMFEPVERDYDPLNTNMPNQDYVGTAIYDISGTVTLVGGAASVTDVTLELAGDANETISPNGDGTYSFTGLAGGDYTITPSLAGYSFVPEVRSYTPLDADMTDQNFVATFVPLTFGISGTVTLIGGPASVTDVTLLLSGNALLSTNPEADGTYAFGTLLTGDYTVTPSLASYVFEPVNREYTSLDADQVDQDFVGTYAPEIYGISGTVTLVGGTSSVTEVTLQLQGDTADSMNSAEDGTYAFSDVPAGNYILVPSLAGYIFEPNNRQYSPLDADQVDQDFVGTYVPGTFSIFGTVTLVGGTATPSDVVLELRGDVEDSTSPSDDGTYEDGTYAFVDLPAGNYIVIPSLQGYRFEPGSREYAPLDATQIGQDFVGYFVRAAQPAAIGHGRGGAGGPACFIATAAYGTPTASEISVLSDFRDRYLLTNRVGTAFVRTYYRFSPPIARFIANHELLRAVVRAVLTPIVAIAKLTMTSPLSVAAILLAGVAIALSRARRRRFLSER
jgi:WD40 repeat protein